MSQLPIFVINLKRSPHRRELIKASLDSIGLPFEFFDAIDGLELSDSEVAKVYDDATRIRLRGKGLSKTEVACYLSHNTCSGTQCYGISIKAANKILSKGFPITRQIDIFIDEYWRSDLDILAVQPYPVHLDEELDTDMHHKDLVKGSFRTKVMRRISESSRKLRNSFAKRLTNIKRSSWPILSNHK